MPRESIQITGIQIEHIDEDHVRVTVRTPDNSNFVIYEGGLNEFIGAQKMLTLKREYQEKIAAARVEK